MFLRTITLLLFCITFALSAGVYDTPGHTKTSYSVDTDILRRRLAKDPADLKTRRSLVLFLNSVEQFDAMIVECRNYLRRSEDAEIRYLMVLALASSSKYDEAVTELDRYISKHDPSADERELLRKKRILYSESLETKGEPFKADEIAQDEVACGVDESEKILIVYNSSKMKLMARSLINGEVASLPVLPPKTPVKELLSIVISQDGQMALASFRDGDSVTLVVSTKRGRWGAWQYVSELNEGAINAYPTFLNSNQEILFVSNRDGSQGLDVYYARRSGSGWSKPVAVPVLNTKGDEASVYVPAGSSQLYLATNGREGLGGFDLFQAKIHALRSDTTMDGGGIPIFSTLKNINLINTYRNEVTPPYTLSKKSYYLVSIIDADKSTLYAVRSLGFAKPKVITSKPKPIVVVPKSGTFVAKDILFDTGSADIRPVSNRFLNSLVKFLKENPEKAVIIAGHTDSVGTEEKNKALSKSRADAVAFYLIKNGINKSRIKTKGYGTSKKIASNNSVEGRQKNRRVEITIYKK